MEKHTEIFLSSGGLEFTSNTAGALLVLMVRDTVTRLELISPAHVITGQALKARSHG